MRYSALMAVFNQRYFAYTGLLALFGLLTACGDRGPEQKGPQQQMPKVSIVEVEPQSVPRLLDMTGRTRAHTVAEIRPQVEGIIEARLFTEGATVAKGDVLYQIDDASYQAIYDNASAAVAQSEAVLTNAQLKVKRNRRLVKINAVSEQVLDDALAAEREALANLAANKAALKSASINLERTQIKAPIDGVIGRSTITEGALVSANQPQALATLQQLAPIYVDFSVPSAKAMSLKANLQAADSPMPVTLLLNNARPYPHQGEIILSEFEVDPTTDSVVIRAQFANPDHHLLPGMFIHGRVENGVSENRFLVPAVALQRDPVGKPFVYVLDENQQVQARPVVPERLHQESWVIKDGLKTDDKVVTEGLQMLRPGIQVQLADNGKK
ncbi:MAG: efflux RND transporter periplasmic adaptor subunit [Hydrogenovibrio sp.]|uniref:efflux RND transporter periplasmic adaptor subunit n=1 Tax=Hydrogenovibrio sp. TaxID=2065821 RepID=UPI00287070B3|nr:efflux RND transporter periplasmic adaptor subunit [Hydrogenovibrio sp.]MDR9497876.1 efflux RND transporter periplasmic adaptor subunit [Hydrogenovibrio sp.]